MLKVAKFGGSSLSDGVQFEKVKRIIESDLARKVVVVSAPGKKSNEDSKVTDLLYLCNAHIKYDVSYDDIFDMIDSKFRDIKNDCGLSLDLDFELAEIRTALNDGASLDYIVSRGEYLNAKLMAEYLGYTFVDSKDWVALGYDGRIDHDRTEEKLKEIFDIYGRIVVPGFYGALPNGDVKTFSRGGSDITGAIAAASLDADVYENWTDVTGIKMADPRIVDDPRTISQVTYAELRELSYMGAAVLHEDTVFPVRRKDIPLNIRNTNEPDADGTFIRASFPGEGDDDSQRLITGITGIKDYSIINIFKSNMSENMDILRKALEMFEAYGMHVSHILSNIDSFSLVIPTAELDRRRYDLIQSIQKDCDIDEIDVTDGISMIAVIGRRLAYRTGTSGRIFSALGENGINIRTIEQSANEINIMIGVFTEDFERAIRVLYDSFAK